ncbi:MAG TPA: PepSY domain-containing protein [Armatimonadota bacterium]|jgi:uncharacterized iron-regulated membrane protein
MKKTALFVALSALIASAAMAAPKPKAKAPAPKVKVTAVQASKAALAKYPGKVVGKVALENEDGKWQYAVNVRSAKTLREVMVDANTGKIASVEVTSPKEEAKEAAAEKKAAGKGAKAKPVEKGEANEKD